MIYLFPKANIKVDFDSEKCSITSINFKGEELIEKGIPLFRIKYRGKDGAHYWVDSFAFSFKKEIEGQFDYTSDNADVSLFIKQLDNGLQFGIDVINKTDLLLEQVEIMSLGLYPFLLDENGKGEMDVPYNEGERITSIERRNGCSFHYYEADYPSLSCYHLFPNMISSPFMSYIVNQKGIYFGMHDKSYTPKHIDFDRQDNVLKTFFGVFTNCNYGESYHMDFPSVLLFFEGNYFDACEIYREWFYENKPNYIKTIKEKYNEYPKWYHESPVVLTYPLVGTADYDLEMKVGNLYPYTNALPIVDYISKGTDSPVMVILMQWESTAPWAPPYVWPPYGDVENFYQFRDKLHENGNYLGVYTSGFGWTNVSHRREYDRTEEYEKNNLKEIMCSDTNGFLKSTVVQDIRLSYDMCPACEKTKEIIVNEANKMIDAKLDYIQILDQNHGGHPYFCYSDKHGHIPAPGKWQIEETRKLLSSLKKGNYLIGCETAASEPYIDLLPFSDNRYPLIHHMGEAIPMYSYIYHEFVNNFMGNQCCVTIINDKYSYLYRVAYSFICGDITTMIIDGDSKLHLGWGSEVIIDYENPLKLINMTNQWRRGFAEYLHLGKMVKPLEFKCKTVGAGSRFYVFHYELPLVLSSAYTNGKDTYQFFINYDDVEQEIELEKSVDEIVISSDRKVIPHKGNKIVIPPLSVIAIKR